MSAYTDRGGAVFQKKPWQPLILTRATFFVHCGSAPFAQDTTGILLKYSKEICTVDKTTDTKWILGFPLVDITQPHYVPNEILLSKPCQLLWSMQEMPRGFVFQIPVGKTVYTKGAVLKPDSEVGFNFDIIFEDYLVAQYQRITKQKMNLQPLTGVSWF